MLLNAISRFCPEKRDCHRKNPLITWCFFALATLLSPMASANGTEVNKGSIDKRQYHYEQLDNRLKVLLISDPDADKAAAALNVNVGSFDDPLDREGLAHFLEHMLFLGTKKYPEADEYQSFISDKGGSHNAYTSRHHTNYFFDVDASHLEPALDRFAQFFIAPLFDELYVERERNVVYSEFKAGIRDDYRRSYDSYREVVNPAHPDAKFNVGNLQTLADRPDDKVRDDLIAFYQTHYSAEQMALVVLSSDPIANLRKLVVPRFGKIPLRDNNSDPVAAEKVPVFEPGRLPLEIISRPLKELRTMSMSFELPGVREYYRSKPLDYIGYILGHEGRGSLLSLLKQQGLAEHLSVSSGDKGDNTANLNITLVLTKAGVVQRSLVRALVFHAIDEIKDQGVEQWRFDEQRLLSDIAFQFREQRSAIATVSHLARNLFYYPPADVISGDYLHEKFDENLIQRFLSLMTPNNLFVSTLIPDAITDRVSVHYQAPYQVLSLPVALPELDEQMTANFALPAQNPFIPESVTLFDPDPALAIPTVITGENTELWSKQDLSYATPKAKVFLRVLSPRVSGNVEGVALAALYVSLLRDKLNEFSYPAHLAGASLSLRAHNRGVDIILTGYHQKLHKLMVLLVDELNQAQFDFSRFKQLKSDLLRSWRNSDKKTPYRQLYNQLAINLYGLLWSDEDKISALSDVTVGQLQTFADDWRKGARVQGLFYGNIDQGWLKDWQGYAQSMAIPGELAVTPARILRLNEQQRPFAVYPVEHNDQAAILYIQGPSDSLADRAAMAVLRQIMRSPFYNTLRTEQQLGYIVFMGSLRLKQVPGSVFVVQSPSADINHISRAIEQFIKNFEAQFPSDIGIYQQAVVTQLLESPATLSASADDYWNNLLQGNQEFDNRQRLAVAVQQLTAEQMLNYFRQVVVNPKGSLWYFSRAPEDIDTPSFVPGEGFYSYP